MKKTLAAICIMLTAFAGFGQYFEGKITYHNSYKSKSPQVSSQQLSDMVGAIEEYYIKNGDYKAVTNGNIVQWQLYINRDNKLYNKMSNSETLYWVDGDSKYDSVVNIRLTKNATEILGYKCDELVVTCRTGTQTYYFNSKLKLDAKLFANHKYGNWCDYVKSANAVPLKMIIDSPEVTMESVATEVTPMKLEDKEFQLPAGAKTEPSPF